MSETRPVIALDYHTPEKQIPGKASLSVLRVILSVNVGLLAVGIALGIITEMTRIVYATSIFCNLMSLVGLVAAYLSRRMVCMILIGIPVLTSFCFMGIELMSTHPAGIFGVLLLGSATQAILAIPFNFFSLLGSLKD